MPGGWGWRLKTRTLKIDVLLCNFYKESISRQQLIIKHSYFIHFRFHDIGPLGRSQGGGGGARGQNLELPEFFSFYFLIETTLEDGWSFIF